MKVAPQTSKRPRIEMIPLIDMVFLLLVFFIYGMLSMAVHRGLPVVLPTSSTAPIDQRLVLSVTLQSDGTIYVDKVKVSLENLKGYLATKSGRMRDSGILLFADRDLSYQTLFRVLDEIRIAGFTQISLQADRRESR